MVAHAERVVEEYSKVAWCTVDVDDFAVDNDVQIEAGLFFVI